MIHNDRMERVLSMLQQSVRGFYCILLVCAICIIALILLMLLI